MRLCQSIILFQFLLILTSLRPTFSLIIYSPHIGNFTYDSLIKKQVNFSEIKDLNREKLLTIEYLKFCQEAFFNTEEVFKECLKYMFKCIKLYCELPKVYKDDQCLSASTKFQWEKIARAENVLQDRNILFVYDGKKDYGAVKSTIKYNTSTTKYFLLKLVALSESPNSSFELVELAFNIPACGNPFDQYLNESYKEILGKLTLAANFISFLSFLIVILFYLLVTETRTHISGKCWIMFSVMSMLNYVIPLIGLMQKFDESLRMLAMLDMLLVVFLFGYFFLEFSPYFWLCVTCFETFYGLR